MMIGYARKSKEKQNLATQIQLLVKYGVLIDDIYSDTESGATMADTRPGFIELKKRIASGNVTELVVSEISRIGRDSKDSMLNMLEFEKLGIKITSLAENEKYISDLPLEAQLTMTAAMCMGADIERKHISERTKWAMKQIKDGLRPTKSGKPIGRPIVNIDFNKVNVLVGKGISTHAAILVLGYHPATFYRKQGKKRIANMKDIEQGKNCITIDDTVVNERV